MLTARTRAEAPIDRVAASVYRIPTEAPESDGTLEWEVTTLVVVEVASGDRVGMGYSYADAAAALVVHDVLRERVEGREAFAVEDTWRAMTRAVRNIGRRGIAACAISAVDAALWDLKAKLLDLPLVTLLGRVRPRIAAYGSGGFTSLSIGQLRDQLGAWAAEGHPAVKMKVGREPSLDPERVRAARAAIGNDVALYVDANGAYTPKSAVWEASAFADAGVSWFEEPVSSDDIAGLRFVRERVRGGMDVAAGEYAYDVDDHRGLLAAGAVDVLQADASRCLGITGFLKAAALAEAYHVPLSSHTAPSLHLHPCCAAGPVRDLEWFYDHVRIERMLFDGFVEPDRGALAPDLSRPGLGIELRRADAARFAVHP